MFDRYTTQKDRLVPYEKTVTHHNAPTVEQARYLDELRAQARDDVLQGLLVETPLGTVHSERLRYEATAGDRFVVSWLFQGKVQRVEFTIEDTVLAMAGGDLGLLANAVAKEFYRHVCSDLAIRFVELSRR